MKKFSFILGLFINMAMLIFLLFASFNKQLLQHIDTTWWTLLLLVSIHSEVLVLRKLK